MPPRFWCACISAALLFCSLLQPARGVTAIWQADPSTPADWFDPANWSTNAIPSASDTAQINNGQAQISSGAATTSVLSLGTSAGDVGSLSITGGQLTATTAYVGNNGSGAIIQSGGALIGSSLYIDSTYQGPSSYSLQGTASLSFTGSEVIGVRGAASFTQSGGVNTTGYFYLAGSGSYTNYPPVISTYSLSGGELNSTNSFYVGYSGSAVFTQSGGAVRILTNGLYIGYGSGASGTYNLLGNASLYTPDLYLNYQMGASGTFNLSGNASLSSYNEYIGGSGTFVQTSGTNTTGYLYISNPASSYSISNTALLSAQHIEMDYGSFQQSGGTVAITNSLTLAYPANSSAAYSLSGSTSVLSLSGSGGVHLAPGSFSSASFIQSGGTFNTNSQPLYLAEGLNSSATYSLSDGILLTGAQIIGHTGSGTFTQSGGTNNLGAGYLYLGFNNSASRGLYLLTGPAATLVSGAEIIGSSASASSLFRQSAGDNFTGALTIYSKSRYELSGGSLHVATSLTNSGTLDLLAGSLSTPSLVNNGTLNLSASASLYAPASPTLAFLTGTGSTSVAAGAILSASYITQSTLSLDGTLFLSSPATSSSLTSLILSSTGRLDLTANTLLVSSSGLSPAATIRQYLHDALLFSSTANSDPLHLRTLGYLLNSSLITIKTTYVGDANLDGSVNADDYALLDQGFATHASTWWLGDFNYDGQITSADYLLIDRTYALLSGPLSPDFLSLRQAQFGQAYVDSLLTSIPEPLFTTWLIAILPLVSQRRGR